MGRNGPSEAHKHQVTCSGAHALGATAHTCHKRRDCLASNIWELAKLQAKLLEVPVLLPKYATLCMLVFLDWSDMLLDSSRMQEKKRC